MEDKTPIYMLVIVAIVAIVGLIIMMTNNASTPMPTAGSMMTGNVIAGQANSVTLFGKLFFTVFLFGIAGYMYFKQE